MSLILADEKLGNFNQKWLGSAHATSEAQTVTLKVEAFSAFGDTIPSGVPLKKNEKGTYEPVTDAGDTLAGFLFTDQPARGEFQVAPMLWHGRIRPKHLPEKAFDITTLTNVPPLLSFPTKPAAEEGVTEDSEV
ncbi:hypothetical protein ABRP69_10105 [Corynebacterium sp. KPL3806]|jgi:hypothetical protein|uniref:hypothetical protein n=1 Tax=unclassified Corynebacterium TaxID=2624378 RepID=UPI0003B7E3CE|nr:hypothetical protein [Corynebacterium sp. KPL1818]ERS57578.1 hypothetical protein HMPREF1261_02251 [Corynebacterium sp. KPL1818]DAX90496.1 MAG TPA: HEAD DECORATION PROTEIN [Caudoviricetes sp.]